MSMGREKKGQRQGARKKTGLRGQEVSKGKRCKVRSTAI
jgi:hypothetical protein